MKYTTYLFSYLIMLPLAVAVFIIAMFTGLRHCRNRPQSPYMADAQHDDDRNQKPGRRHRRCSPCPVFRIVGPSPHGLSGASLFIVKNHRPTTKPALITRTGFDLF